MSIRPVSLVATRYGRVTFMYPESHNVEGKRYELEWWLDHASAGATAEMEDEESNFEWKDTEEYDTLVEALKRWHFVTSEAPYDPTPDGMGEYQFIVLLKDGHVILDERLQYKKEKSGVFSE
jgi:hypothetical protein